ncbi:hypothetical protein [Paenibacillus sp. FSL P2-0173]|uniref:hypothetical protein n=1 Tax=Paenibacillus sp. FSL P2-0173 TaxID=2921627 RepID=UPI0030FAC044
MILMINHIDEYIKSYKEYYDIFLDNYRKRVMQYYTEEYKQHPENFRLMNKVRITTLFRTGEFFAYFFESKSGQDEYITIKSFFKDEEEAKSYLDLPKHIQKDQFNKLLIDNEIIDYFDYETHWYGMDDDPHPDWDEDVPVIRGKGKADSDYDKKIASSKTIANIFNVEELVSTVNDEDFQYEYEEALRAYQEGLFLASSVTAAVALETLLKIAFVKTFSIDDLPKIYYILTLADKLKESGKIDERLHHRIKSVNELRRGVAHSKSGHVSKWDAEQVIGSIKVIADSLF